MEINFNWLAVLVATFSSFVIGAIWFGPKTFYPAWIRAQGRTVPTERVEMSKGETFLMFGGTFVAAFIQVATLELVLQQLAVFGQGVDWSVGAAAALILGVGFGAFGSLSHRMFGQYDHKVYRSLKVWLIEISQDVLALVVAGVILGSWL